MPTRGFIIMPAERSLDEFYIRLNPENSRANFQRKGQYHIGPLLDVISNSGVGFVRRERAVVPEWRLPAGRLSVFADYNGIYLTFFDVDAAISDSTVQALTMFLETQLGIKSKVIEILTTSEAVLKMAGPEGPWPDFNPDLIDSGPFGFTRDRTWPGWRWMKDQQIVEVLDEPVGLIFAFYNVPESEMRKFLDDIVAKFPSNLQIITS